MVHCHGMNLVILPLHAASGARPELARQIANFLAEVGRGVVGEGVNAVNYLARTEVDGIPRMVQVNPSEGFGDSEMIEQLFAHTDADVACDGLLAEHGDELLREGTITLRWHRKGEAEPEAVEAFEFQPNELFAVLRRTLVWMLGKVDASLPEEAEDQRMLFGTESQQAFVNLLIGFDGVQYIEKAEGAVMPDFSPEPTIAALLAANEADPEWSKPVRALLVLAHYCMRYGIGSAQVVESALLELSKRVPDSEEPWVALGELYKLAAEPQRAVDALEKANRLRPNEAEILARLGQAQLASGMPINAERTLRRAAELETEEKPSLDVLALVLENMGRGHETPELFRAEIERRPDHPKPRMQYAMALIRNDKKDEASQILDQALEELEDEQAQAAIKRFYAPLLFEREDFDRAMDYYEDALDVDPTDVSVLLEYAQTLQAAGRSFEIPKVLRDVLSASSDQNTKAQTQAWLLELDEPKRTEVVAQAQEKLNAGEPGAAIATLKPVRNWLADYWKLWLVSAAAHNRLESFEEAEKDARKLLEIFPACEPGYAELSTALIGQGRANEAYALLKIALSNMNQSLTIAINLAHAAKQSGKTDEALALVRTIREATRGDENVERMLTLIERD